MCCLVLRCLVFGWLRLVNRSLSWICSLQFAVFMCFILIVWLLLLVSLGFSVRCLLDLV